MPASRRLHLAVVGLAECSADRGCGVAGDFRQLSDIASREDQIACARADKRIDAGKRLIGAHRGGCRNVPPVI